MDRSRLSSKRRHRSTTAAPLRDSHAAGGGGGGEEEAELRETVMLRAAGGDGDRELITRNNTKKNKKKKKKSKKKKKEEEERVSDRLPATGGGSVLLEEEESEADGDCDDDTRHRGVEHVWMSSVSPNHNNMRRGLVAHRLPEDAPLLNGGDEIIGVPVPRKARSASVKRVHESWVSGGGASTSTNDSVLKKMRLDGPRAYQKTASSSGSGSVQEDIEIEVAEVLFGLMKQSRSSKKEAFDAETAIPKVATKNFSDSARTTVLAPNDSTHSHPVAVSKKVKAEADTVLVQSSSEVGKGGTGITHEQSGAATTKISLGTIAESVLHVDCKDLPETKQMRSTAPLVKIQREEKFDLMAPPLMTSSPEQDRFSTLSSCNQIAARYVATKVENVVKNEGLVKKELVLVEPEENKTKMTMEKLGSKLDLGTLYCLRECGGNSKLQQKPQPKATIAKVEGTAQPSKMPLPISLAAWPSGLPPFGYTPPLQSAALTGAASGSSTAIQPPAVTLSQHHPKRCATHHYIATKIHLHQQVMKMHHFWPTPADSAVFSGSVKQNSVDAIHSSGKMIGGRNPLRGSFQAVHANSVSDSKHAVINSPALNGQDKAQVVLHQSAHPAPVANTVSGHTFFFPIGQHPSPVAPRAFRTETPKSANDASVGVATGSKPLPAAATALSYGYASVSNEASCLTRLPNNVYPYPLSSSAVNQSAMRGPAPSQALPFYKGSLYSSQIHPSRVQQNSSTSNGSSTSHMQLQTAQGPHISATNDLTLTGVRSLQPKKQQVPSKLGAETNVVNTTASVDTQGSHLQNAAHSHGQNYMIVPQPNFALTPSPYVGDRQEQKQSWEKGLKEGSLVPAQAFFMLHPPSYSGNSTASNHKFSSMPQNPIILQRSPEMTRQGYWVLPATAQHAVKTGTSSTNTENVNSMPRKSPASNGHTLVFDHPGRTALSFAAPFAGNWPSSSIPLTTNTSTAVSSQQQPQQLVQIQKQHASYCQQSIPTGAASGGKAVKADNLPVFNWC